MKNIGCLVNHTNWEQDMKYIMKGSSINISSSR